MQLCVYYRKSLNELVSVCKSPCFLVKVFGPNIAISGAVHSEKPATQRALKSGLQLVGFCS